MQWLNSTGIAVSLFFILFLFGKKNRKRADYLLILINFLIISFLALDIAVRTHLSPLLLFFQNIAPYLLFPIFIFFAMDTVQENYGKRWMLLFIPVLCSACFLIADLFIINSYDAAALQKLYETPPISYHIIYKGNQILFLVALIWLIKRLRQYARNIKQQFSFIDPIQLSWLTQISWAYLALMVVSILIFVISNFQWLPINIHSAYSIVSLGVVLAVFYISYHGIRQYTVAEYYGQKAAEEIPLEEPVLTTPAASPEKYKTSSLTNAEQEMIYQNLLRLFEDKKVFLEAKLQLQEVADALNVTTHNLSQTINSITGKPFYDFVNGYRVKHLQKLLADPAMKRFTILALGMDSGFNSKASLNRIFKAETGLSPKEYQLQTLAA
ncbi:MAG: AraC family transcriptional regulator [Bacteroidetes bacterium]|nr:AraC family transcriptional regulator [Bacteroidota bacterium]